MIANALNAKRNPTSARERRLIAGVNFLTDLYNEPGFLLINYTVRQKLRDILGKKLSNETLDRDACRRITMQQMYNHTGKHWL